jgi:hypothetical protein
MLMEMLPAFHHLMLATVESISDAQIPPPITTSALILLLDLLVSAMMDGLELIALDLHAGE